MVLFWIDTNTGLLLILAELKPKLKQHCKFHSVKDNYLQMMFSIKRSKNFV